MTTIKVKREWEEAASVPLLKWVCSHTKNYQGDGKSQISKFQKKRRFKNLSFGLKQAQNYLFCQKFQSIHLSNLLKRGEKDNIAISPKVSELQS